MSDGGAQGRSGGDAGGELCAPGATVYLYTVEVIGEALEEAEGAGVHVYTAMKFASSAASCTGQGVTGVSAGTFSLTVTSHSDGAAYPRVVVWVDVDGDGECGSGDLLHDQYWTALMHTSRTLSRADFEAPAAEACKPFDSDGIAEEESHGTAESCTFVDPSPVAGDMRADLTVRGTGLQAQDGETVWVRTSTWDLSPIAVAKVVVEGGGFEVELPDGLTDYTGVGVYLDLDDDGRCSPDEPMHEVTTGVANVDSVLELTASDLAPGDCLVNGGVGVLSETLSCTP